MIDFENADHDENGAPICGDEYCPGFPDCTACADLRQAEWLHSETANEGGEPTR